MTQNPLRTAMMEAFGLEEAISDKGALRAIFLCGGPGSGKSYTVKELMKNIYPQPKIIDSDRLFMKKLSVAQLPTVIPAKNSSSEQERQLRDKQMALRQNALDSIDKVLHTYLNNYMPILIDGTGKTFDKMVVRKETLEKLGYDTMLLFVNTSLEVAQERNAKRERRLPATGPESVEEIWNLIQSNIEKYKQLFGENCLIVNNDPGMLDVAGMVKKVDKFFQGPPKNPIGRALVTVKDTPSSRQVSPENIVPFK